MALPKTSRYLSFNLWTLLAVIFLSEESISQANSTSKINTTTSTINLLPTSSLKLQPQPSQPSQLPISDVIKPSSAVFTISPSSLNTASFNVSPCVGKKQWKVETYETSLECLTRSCASTTFTQFDRFMRCNDRSIVMDMLVIGGYISKYALKRAEKMITPLGRDPKERMRDDPPFRRKKDFYVEYGFIRSRFLRRSSPVSFPQENLGDGVGYKMPPTMMTKDVHAYVYTEFSTNIYLADTKIDDYTPEENSLNEALYLLEGGSVDDPPVPSTVANVFNSKIVTVRTKPLVQDFTEYVDIQFTLRDPKGTINHKCVHAPGHLGQVKWTNKGCYTLSSTITTIHCRCNSPNYNFAILSELFVPPEVKSLERDEKFALALVVICAIGVLVCFLCLILPPCVGCSYVGGMIRIYRYSDLTQAVEYIIIIIGVYARRHEIASALIAVVLHFLHCSVMFWALIEGIYLYHKVKPQFHRSTGTMFFYSTMVFGISAALSGAAAGYEFNFGPDLTYVWVYIKQTANGSEDLIYLLIPIIFMILFSIAIVWVLILQQKNWIGFQDDYVYSRTPYFIRRQSTFVLVCLATHITGTMSIEGSLFMKSVFAAFLALQFVCRFYSHFIWNYEVWEWKKFNDAYKYNEKTKLDERFKQQAKENTQHTALLIGGSSSSNTNSSSSSDDEDEDDGVEVERMHQRPTSVYTVASRLSQEIEERTVTPQVYTESVSKRSTFRPNPTTATVDSIPDLNIEEKKEEKDEVKELEPGKSRKERKPSIQPRMTKAAAMRRQSVVTQSLLE